MDAKTLIKYSHTALARVVLPTYWSNAQREQFKLDAIGEALTAVLVKSKSTRRSDWLISAAQRAIITALDHEMARGVKGLTRTEARDAFVDEIEQDSEQDSDGITDWMVGEMLGSCDGSAGDERGLGRSAGGGVEDGNSLSTPATVPHPATDMSGHDGRAGIEARDWWDTTKGGLGDDCYNACALVFGLDGHDELGYADAAARLGVDETTVRRRVGRAGGERGEG